MRHYFISCVHKERFINMTSEDDMSLHDLERASLFYIIAGNDDLYTKRKFIYDCTEHAIRHCLEDSNVDFSSSMRSLIRLGFNLYNGWSDTYTTPLYLLSRLDKHNLLLAENAMMIRFNSSLIENIVAEYIG